MMMRAVFGISHILLFASLVSVVRASSPGVILPSPDNIETFIVTTSDGIWVPTTEPLFVPDIEIWENLVGFNEEERRVYKENRIDYLNNTFGLDASDEEVWTITFSRATSQLEYRLSYGMTRPDFLDGFPFPNEDERHKYERLMTPDTFGHILHDALLVFQVKDDPVMVTKGRFNGTELPGGTFLLSGFYNFELSREGVGQGEFVQFAYQSINPVMASDTGLIPFVCAIESPVFGCGFIEGVSNLNEPLVIETPDGLGKHVRTRSTLNFGVQGFECVDVNMGLASPPPSASNITESPNPSEPLSGSASPPRGYCSFLAAIVAVYCVYLLST